MVREQWVDIRNFYTHDNISQELPNIKTACRQYMTKMLDESYTVHKEDCVKLGKKSVSFTTFCKFRPKKVFTINKTPDRQPICDQCENFRLLRQAFCVNKLQGIASHTNECIKESMVKVSTKVSNAGSNMTENISEDDLHQVDPNYGHFSCKT